MSQSRGIKKLKSLFYVCSGATVAFSAKCYLEGHEGFFDNILLPTAHLFEPEAIHKFAIFATKRELFPKPNYSDPPILKSTLWGIEFENPLGIAAGFDKDGEAVSGLSRLGFGFVEVGSVTPLPQPGNPKPRLFRLTNDKAIINRYGFNSSGYENVYERVKAAKMAKNDKKIIVGVNLGKNRSSIDPIDDYVKGIQLFGPVADYLVINISSPNTPGLRDLQRKKSLETLLKALVGERKRLPVKPPLLLKLSPDLEEEEEEEIASVILNPECRVNGLIISNTSIKRKGILEDPKKGEEGGLSGLPLSAASTRLISRMYFLTRGEIPIIGVGGVFTGEDAYEKIKAGASLVQIYTAFTYHGPPRILRIKKDLQALLEADGHLNISEAVGKDVDLNQRTKKL